MNLDCLYILEMKIYFVSIFPEIFESFLETSLIKKACEKNILEFELCNPRDFCEDKHKQVDDEIYWWGDGLLIKAKPVIDCVEEILEKIGNNDWKIIFLSPSKKEFNQEVAHELTNFENIIFVSGRYEWIDKRFEEFMWKKYGDKFEKISVWKFVCLGGEVPAMLITESVVRLVDWVIKEENSWKDESYRPENWWDNLEYPQYTRPQNVYDLEVPEVLLNGNHAEIKKWREENSE